MQFLEDGVQTVVKQVYWYISQVSGEHLQDHWSSVFCCFFSRVALHQRNMWSQYGMSLSREHGPRMLLLLLTALEEYVL